jgi:hypothetical protein
MSFPVFSKNMNYCLLAEEYFCGPLCGEGRILLYKKDDHGWHLEQEVLVWIS